MKRVGLMVLALVGCDPSAVVVPQPDAGVAGSAAEVGQEVEQAAGPEAGPEAAGVAHDDAEAPIDCQAVPTTRFGGNTCLFRVPSSVTCSTAILFVDGRPADQLQYVRLCDGADLQIMVTGGACSALERGAVATIGCSNQ